MIAGQVKSQEFWFLSPGSRAALNKREGLRWYALLLEGNFSDNAAQLAKDYTDYCRLASDMTRIIFKNPNALTKFIRFLAEF